MRVPTVLALSATLLLLAGGGYLYWSGQKTGLVPTGFAIANGRKAG